MVQLKKNISVSENGFVFNSTTGDSYSVNETAADILLLIQEGKDEEAVKKAFQEKYEVDDLSFERSFFDFTRQLQSLGLIIV